MENQIRSDLALSKFLIRIRRLYLLFYNKIQSLVVLYHKFLLLPLFVYAIQFDQDLKAQMIFIRCLKQKFSCCCFHNKYENGVNLKFKSVESKKDSLTRKYIKQVICTKYIFVQMYVTYLIGKLQNDVESYLPNKNSLN